MRYRSELRTCFTMAAAISVLAGTAQAQPVRRPGKKVVEVPAALEQPRVIHAVKGGFSQGPFGGTDCTDLRTHTDFNFANGGNANVQAGFSEGESAAATYTLPASAFPVKLLTAEILFATAPGVAVTTTTHWTIRVWQGTPTNGTVVHTESSDGNFLPHIVITPPANNALLSYQIDPSDPNQVIIANNGSNSFTIEFRIDEHNNPPGDPCSQSPPSNSNAFPTTDIGGVAAPGGNWINALQCGGLACPGGWWTFQGYPSICRPSGDWVMRATFEPANCSAVTGACCFTNGTCQMLTAAECQTQGGSYRGNSVQCSAANCSSPEGACCFGGGGCLVQTQADCTTIGGTFQGAGTQCAGSNCPVGACCLPSGTCLGGVTIAQCSAQNGVFQGPQTTCATVQCPQPTGACCAPSGGCLVMTQANCNVIPGVWAGPGTACGTTNCQAILCYPNCDGSTQAPTLNVNDFSCYLTRFAAGEAYANCDGSTQEPVLNVNDFSCFLTKFAAGCP